MSELDHEIIERAKVIELEIAEKDSKIQKCEDIVEREKKTQKGLEAERETLVDALRKLIRGEDAGLNQPPLPFAAADENAGGSPEPAKPAPVKKKPWRSVTIEELGIGYDSLREAGISTLGRLADFTAANKKLIDLKGVGQSKVEKIEKAVEKYWAENPPEDDSAQIAVKVFSAKGGADATEIPPDATETPADASGETKLVQTIPASEMPPVGQVDGLASIPVELLGEDFAAAAEEAFNECRNTFSEIAKGNAPKLRVLQMADDQNRFSAGRYVIVEKKDDRYYRMQRVYEESEWMPRLGQYARENENQDPPGILASNQITDIDSSQILFCSGEDEQFFVDLGAPAGQGTTAESQTAEPIDPQPESADEQTQSAATA